METKLKIIQVLECYTRSARGASIKTLSEHLSMKDSYIREVIHEMESQKLVESDGYGYKLHPRVTLNLLILHIKNEH